MRNISEIKSNPHLSNITIYDEAQKAGYGVIHLVRWKGTVIFDSTSTPWEHVSVSPKKKGIIPTWYELKLIKEIPETVSRFIKKSTSAARRLNELLDKANLLSFDNRTQFN